MDQWVWLLMLTQVLYAQLCFPCVSCVPAAGCGFVTFEKWSYCELAIEALHNKHHLDGAKLPLVVKFADAPHRAAIVSMRLCFWRSFLSLCAKHQVR